jgi:serpin B
LVTIIDGKMISREKMPVKMKRTHSEMLLDVDALVQGISHFALDLYQQLRTTEGNLFYSPYSLSVALAMTYAGARAETESQMRRTLHFSLGQETLPAVCQSLEEMVAEAGQKFVLIKTANAIWPGKGYKFHKEYLAHLQKFFGVKITPIDFSDEASARKKINGWVEEKTANKIRDLIPAGVLDNLTRMVLVNAIYFKGDWAAKFDPQLTREGSFWVKPDQETKAQMMTCRHTFRIAEFDDLQLLELPYAGGSLSMLVILPLEVDGLMGVELSLTPERLKKWSGSLRESEMKIILPRFEMSHLFRLDAMLKVLGMEDAFSTQADFSGMDGSRELYIGAALHKAFIAINEQGTEAAAASAVVMQAKSIPFPQNVFNADHPFLFLIRENRTGSILFMGRVANPA